MVNDESSSCVRGHNRKHRDGRAGCRARGIGGPAHNRKRRDFQQQPRVSGRTFQEQTPKLRRVHNRLKRL